MPVANLNVLAGHPRESLKSWVREASRTVADILGAPLDRLEIWVTEIDPDLWGISGEPASDVLQTQSRRSSEMPLIRMVLLEGRSAEQHHRLIGELSALTARLLDVELGRIRVQIDQAHPDRWGIGGVPASILRAGEIAARKNAS